ncbi:hypothetical protein CALVIDRAFT_247108 [Calocera viscosa TUFC12733]|uniref:Uncharacterized protein n=1 Tax=Calocera viscosa (strain TUFC12733) TaxID=1330018 RepID=A0A167JJJ2_CALVF|nr:hypothetical protein CALVIDRAFT_247108 [Calocera viscosa TUFC12733]
MVGSIYNSNGLILVVSAFGIVCIPFAMVILTGLARPWAPWIIVMLMTVSLNFWYCLLFAVRLTPRCVSLLRGRLSDPHQTTRNGVIKPSRLWDTFEALVAIAWLVLGWLMLSEHIDCSPDSAWTQSLNPVWPLDSSDPQTTANLKCILTV